MRIDKIDDALERCDVHLSGATTVDETVQGLLTQSLLILICREFERTFKALIIARYSRVSDESLRIYLESSIGAVFRSLKLGEISGLLARFGPSYKEEFIRLLDANGEAKSMYDSILANRNSVAHGEGSNATIGDVKRYYERGHVVLDYFREALGRDEGTEQMASGEGRQTP